MIPAQRKPIAVLPSGEGRHTSFCLLLGTQVADFRHNQNWKCEGVNRTKHVHISGDTLKRLIEQRRATVLDQERGVVALAAAESSEGEAA